MTDAERFEVEFHAAGCGECGRADLPMMRDGFSPRMICPACYAKRIDRVNLYHKGVDQGRLYCVEDNHARIRRLSFWYGFWFGWLTATMFLGITLALIAAKE